MNPLKKTALAAYYATSLPWRRQQSAARCERGEEPISILFYHRVADDFSNDWTLSRRSFERQIDWIAGRFEIVKLEEAQRRIAEGENRRPTVCLTFDDGYADNCEFALPLLIRRGIPATYFVSSRHVIEGVPFPHDVSAGAPLRPNTLDQLRALATGGIEIGAHTRTHADLGSLAGDRLNDEVLGSKRDLESALGIEVRYFAFPFGMPRNMSSEAFAIAWRAGFHGVCSAYGAYNFPGDDPFHLRRIHADPQMTRLKNWLTVDPRKLVEKGFDPGDYQSCETVALGQTEDAQGVSY